MGAQHLQRHDIQRAAVGCGKVDLRRAAFVGGLHEAARAEAPGVTGFEPGKAVFGAGRAQAVITAQTVWLP